MEAVQCMEGGSEATVKPETNRVLKRNLEELAKDGQINEDAKSPARKGVKIGHESYLRRELEQWKELMNENGIQNSVTYRDTLETANSSNLLDILNDDQKAFLDEAIDVHKMIEQSHEFRKKFEFYAHLQSIVQDLEIQKSLAALDKSKEHAINISISAKQCGIPKFYPPIDPDN